MSLFQQEKTMENEIKFRDYPILGWLFGLSAAGYSVYYLIFNFASPFKINAIVGLAVGLLLLIFGYGLTITADRQTRTLTLDYRSLLLHSVKEIRFDDIATIRIDSRISHNSRRGNRTTTYCIRAELKNGEVVPFRSYYSGGFFGKQKTVDGLRKFMGLPETLDASPAGLLRAAPQIGAAIAKAQQQALTGANAEMRATNGVNWQLQPIGIGATPATRWYSPDFKTRGGFLFLAQKVAGQSSGGFMASLGNALFKQTIGLYGFTGPEMPNFAQASALSSPPPLIDAHFATFTSDQTEARQILTPWVQNPLAEWGQRYPLKQLQMGARFSQLVVMFCPGGVYLATLGVLKPDQVEELANLGVELVKAQGM